MAVLVPGGTISLNVRRITAFAWAEEEPAEPVKAIGRWNYNPTSTRSFWQMMILGDHTATFPSSFNVTYEKDGTHTFPGGSDGGFTSDTTYSFLCVSNYSTPDGYTTINTSIGPAGRHTDAVFADSIDLGGVGLYVFTRGAQICETVGLTTNAFYELHTDDL